MIIICVAVRLKSQRCPKKALADLYGQPLLLRLIERMVETRYRVVVCTSWLPSDKSIIKLCEWHDIPYVAGSPTDVMQRFLDAAYRYQADTIVRVTGDNPLTDPKLLVTMAQAHSKAKTEYTRAIGPPRGTKPEIISVPALKELHRKMGNDVHDSEYMTNYLEKLKTLNMEFKGEGCDPEMRLTVDYPEDLARVRAIYEHFKGNPPYLPELTEWVKNNLTDYYEIGQHQ